jgi:putative PEP-CTERM system histidine kinase
LSFSAVGLTATIVMYGWLSIALTLRGTPTWYRRAFALATAGTAIWALAALTTPEWLYHTIFALRDAGWFVVLISIIHGGASRQVLWRRFAGSAVILLGTDILFSIGHIAIPITHGLTLDSWAPNMAVAAFGLLLIENVARNVSRDQFWAIKLLCIALSTIFAFDLVMEIPRVFLHRADSTFVVTQPLICMLVLPLLVVTAVRMPGVALKVHSSRQAVFHSATVVGFAVVIEGMAAAAFFVRSYGGSIGTAIAVVLLFSGAAALLTAAVSTTLRSRLRQFISENFFNYKYDYRVEWQRFIASLSSRHEEDMPLRVLRTLADVLDCPGGLLLACHDGERKLFPQAQWSVQSDPSALPLQDETLAGLEDENLSYITLESGEAPPLGKALACRYPFGWLALPLRYRGRLIALAILSRPRAARKLDWEDEKFLSLIALQLAVYVVHDEVRKDLDDARKLEAFSRRVAFVTHDMKSSIGQLALLAANAERFGHDEQFRKDMIETLRHSADKLQCLMQRLKGEDGPSPVEAVDLRALLTDFVEAKAKLGLPVQLCQLPALNAKAELDRSGLLSVLEHVVANAVEAAPGSPVLVSLDKVGASLRVSVQDRGQGMAPTFLADELFRPFRSTKGGGFGLGAYQARATMRDLKGDIEIKSRTGRGTTVELLLPAVGTA